MDKEIVRKWLKSGYLEKDVFYRTEAGTPQGGIISPVLANIAVDEIEGLLRANFSRTPEQAGQHKVNMVRYADDFVITGISRELLETKVKPLVVQFMRERGLELSDEKTLVTHIEEGFDFLGQNVRKYSGKMIIKPSRKNVASFLADIREVVKANKAATAGHLIHLLNQKITGWCMYHRHICAASTFAYVDFAIFNTLWRGRVRRHPEKGKRWISAKYFTRVPGEAGGNNWAFYGEVERVDGDRRLIYLKKAVSVRIRRHIKIKAKLNPYAPEWQDYIKRRHSRQEYRSIPARGSTDSMNLPPAPQGYFG